MEYLIFITGIILLLFIVYDFFTTTFSANGFGPVSRKVNIALGRMIIKVNSPGMRKNAGFLHLTLTLFTWLFLLFSAGYIIFISSGQMVINSTTRLPASFIERFYYTGYILSTMGMGDYIPGTPISRIVSTLLSFSGFILLTASLSYLISVFNSVNTKRNLAKFISAMGENPLELYRYMTAGKDFDNFSQVSGQLRQLIISHTNHHLSFPIVHFFLATEHDRSAPVQIASLYEALRFLRSAAQGDKITETKIYALRNSIDDFLSVAGRDIPADGPDDNELEKLRSCWKDLGFDQLPAKDENFTLDKKIDRLLISTGWDWETLYK